MAAGKWTVQPLTPGNILLNWLVAVPKLEVVRAGKLTEVRLVQPLKADLKALLPLIVVRAGKLTEVRLVQP